MQYNQNPYFKTVNHANKKFAPSTSAGPVYGCSGCASAAPDGVAEPHSSLTAGRALDINKTRKQTAAVFNCVYDVRAFISRYKGAQGVA